jgi:uncharacterized membrane protein
MDLRLINIGIAFVFLGFFLILLAALTSKEARTEFAFVGFIGPLPIGIASRKEILYLAIGLSLLLLVFFLLLLKPWR